MAELTCLDCGRRRGARAGDCENVWACLKHLKAQLTQAQAEIAALRAVVAAADAVMAGIKAECRDFIEPGPRMAVYDAARVKLKDRT